MGSLLERLKEWNNIRYTKRMVEDPGIEAGRRAEEFLKELVASNLKYKGAYYYLGKRVRCKVEKRRFEMDLIVLTKKHIYMIEVKNWSGQLVKDGKNWVQKRKHKESLIHPNLTQYNQKKLDVLKEYLKLEKVKLDKNYFSQKVIFINPNLRISKNIVSDPDIVPYKHLENYLSKQKGTTYTERFLHSVVELCLDSEKSSLVLDGLFSAMNSKTFTLAQNALSNLKTWDQIVLHGGRVLTGDALQLNIAPHKPIQMKSFESGKEYKVKWNRSRVFGLMQVLLWRSSLGKIKLGEGWKDIKTTDYVKFHLAGQKIPVNIALREVDSIVKG